jgi:hypothetical protein
MWNRKGLIRILIPTIGKTWKEYSKKYTNIDLVFPVMIEILLSCQGLFKQFPDLSKTLLGSQQKTLGIVCFDFQSRYTSKKLKMGIKKVKEILT